MTGRTKAILPVHLFGQMADIAGLQAISRETNVPLIGDAAQAIGAEQNGHKVGEASLLTTLSFYPTKNLGAAGDGGMILTSDADLNTKLRTLRFHGSNGAYRYEYVGVCSRLDGLQAAVLNVKLPHLPDWNTKRRENAAHYDRALSGIPGLVLPETLAGNLHTFHQYTVRVLSGRRDHLRAFLRERGVASGVFYPYPLHLEAAYLRYGGQTRRFSTRRAGLPRRVIASHCA